MEIGIDSFAGNPLTNGRDDASTRVQAMAELLERMEYADEMGLDVFGIGEHYRQEFLDSAPITILSAAAAKTQNIRLTSAVSVLAASDPVRLFQNFATLDIISNGRAEIVAGRGSFTDSFPLFGLSLDEYDDIFAEKLDLLMQLRENDTITWSGKYRPYMHNQPIYPRPIQDPIPLWVGVGGTTGSFIRAGILGLRLVAAVIGGETHRFRSRIDLYRDAYEKSGHPADGMQFALHSLGYVAETTEQAHEEYYPGYAEMFNKVGKERGWPPVTRAGFDAQAGPTGALLVGSPEEVAEKIVRHSNALGGIVRLTFQMDNAGLAHEQLMRSIEFIGTRVVPIVKDALPQAPE
ncbi:MAG: LLM class flavin-dependent oxidoreductase [Chloroflexota bacterium]